LGANHGEIDVPRAACPAGKNSVLLPPVAAPTLAPIAGSNHDPTYNHVCGFRKFWPLISGNSGHLVILI
jgi:hypothetical protein